MKSFFLFTILAALFTVVSAWTKEDHEIFDLVSALEAAEGRGTTFYSWLEVSPTATTGEIAKAYRKKSMILHPDKNPGVKGIQERFARLGVIATILRNSESRERYDFFYKNGVPKWRGTGYYYSRFRPGLGSVLVYLVFFSSGVQYLVQHMRYKQDLVRIDEVVRAAKAAAWGPKMIPIEGKRKVKVPLGGPRRYDSDGEPIDGKTIDMVVEKDNIYILEPTGDLELLDRSAAVPPSIFSTWMCALIAKLYRRVVRASRPGPQPDKSEDEDLSGSEVLITAADLNDEGSVKPMRAAAAKIVGKRRKTGKR